MNINAASIRSIKNSNNDTNSSDSISNNIGDEAADILLISDSNKSEDSVNTLLSAFYDDVLHEDGKIVCDSSDMLDHRTSTPPRLLVISLVAVLLIIKTIAKVHPQLTKIMPESALFVLFGLFTGIPIGMYYVSFTVA